VIFLDLEAGGGKGPVVGDEMSTLILTASQPGGLGVSAPTSLLAGRGGFHQEDLMVYVPPDDLDRLARRKCRRRANRIDDPGTGKARPGGK